MIECEYIMPCGRCAKTGAFCDILEKEPSYTNSNVTGLDELLNSTTADFIKGYEGTIE